MAVSRYAPIPFQGSFINGQFVQPASPNGEWVGKSPADTGDEFGRFQYSYAAIDEAVRSAKAANPSWRGLSPEARIGYLKKYQGALRDRAPQFIEALAREIGRSLWEARGELEEVLQKIDACFEEYARIQTADAGIQYRPRGVMAVIGPFSGAAYYPNSQFVPALLAGNSVIFKPSEKSPLSGQILAECMQQAGLPNGVFNLVQGEREVGRRLCVHEGVDGILFTGSYDVGVRIKQDTLQQHWKFLSLEMGGKNSMLVWDDADIDDAVKQGLNASFMSAGQRCTTTSRILVHSKLFDQYVDKLHQTSKAFTIGHPMDDPFMGPMVDHGSVDRYMKFIGIAAREGNELVMRGKALELPKPGNYVTPTIVQVNDSSLESARRSVFQQSEYFAPCVGVVSVSDLDQAVALMNATQYGLVSSVYTQDQSVWQKCVAEIQTGWIYRNLPTTTVSPKKQGMGLKKSGNLIPAGFGAVNSCRVSISAIENP